MKCPNCRVKISDFIETCPVCRKRIHYCPMCNTPCVEMQRQCSICKFEFDIEAFMKQSSALNIQSSLNESIKSTNEHYVNTKSEFEISANSIKDAVKKQSVIENQPPVGMDETSQLSSSDAKHKFPISATLTAVALIVVIAVAGLVAKTPLIVQQRNTNEVGALNKGENAIQYKSSYQIVRSACSWEEAYAECEELNEQSDSDNIHLAIIDDYEEYLQVNQLLNEYNASPTTERSLIYCWVGASTAGKEKWSPNSTWIDGSSMNLLWDRNLWWDNQPSNYDTVVINNTEKKLDEDCLLLWNTSSESTEKDMWTFNDAYNELNRLTNYVNPNTLGYLAEIEIPVEE